VRVSAGTILIPDIVVVDPDDKLTTEFAPHEVLLVGEITSPGNAGYDRTRRMRLYAEGGIRWYLLIEPDHRAYETVTLLLFRLDGDHYAEHSAARHGWTLRTDQPFPFEISTADLLED
jgi:Uma2 family endonuclease